MHLYGKEVISVKIIPKIGKNGVSNRYEIFLKDYENPIVLINTESLMSRTKFINAFVNVVKEIPKDDTPYWPTRVKNNDHVLHMQSLLNFAKNCKK
jgi:hypothetical protein